MSVTIGIEEISAAVDGIFTELSSAAIEASNETVKIATKEAVRESRRHLTLGNGVRSGRYRRSITSSIEKETALTVMGIWHVRRPHYRLAHLLENGHEHFYRGWPTGKRTRPIKHISLAEDRAQEFISIEYPRELGKRL